VAAVRNDVGVAPDQPPAPMELSQARGRNQSRGAKNPAVTAIRGLAEFMLLPLGHFRVGSRGPVGVDLTRTTRWACPWVIPLACRRRKKKKNEGTGPKK